MIEFKIFAPYTERLRHRVFGRTTDIDNRNEIGKGLGSAHPAISFENQLHSAIVHIVENQGIPLGGDALITQLPNIPIAIRIADCASILLYDPVTHTAANIHAGWRGMVKRIIAATAERMHTRFNIQPNNLLAAISPMVGNCCSSFSDPYTELPQHMHPFIRENNIVDLWAVVEWQLREQGIEQIENPRICTSCDHDTNKLFWSHRRDKNCGRFGTAIMLR
ncbi:hypothetical protein COV82_00310 [Candidatus Peregrinibacteria bacterium CG11_big_fil_rev_8_21_14_0_20_46_8]|nr:MAG: hypothetical protein COV82_00310 [Candidatus Peregrinibacteria bacterium CG11_big_fil_rev_8_21_14_0_20_46_8]